MQPRIQTHSGLAFDLLDPRPEQVRVEDVAYALSRINRYTGHTVAYSVAQHSVLAMRTVADELREPEHALAALLHDAAEAYVGDVSAPLKYALREQDKKSGHYAKRSSYDVIEGRVQVGVARALGLSDEARAAANDVVKQADLMMLAKEAEILMKQPPPRPWTLPEPPARLVVDPWDAEEARTAFLAAYADCGRMR